MYIEHAFWRYLKRFGTAENKWKQEWYFVHSAVIWNDLDLNRNSENKDAYACLLTLFETIFSSAMRKTVEVLTYQGGGGVGGVGIK